MSFSATTKHKFTNFLTKKWRHDIQHNGTGLNDTQHNNIQHNDTQHDDIYHNDTMNNDILLKALSIWGTFMTLNVHETQHK